MVRRFFCDKRLFYLMHSDARSARHICQESINFKFLKDKTLRRVVFHSPTFFYRFGDSKCLYDDVLSKQFFLIDSSYVAKKLHSNLARLNKNEDTNFFN
jgi:hypothetical protein